MTKVRKAPGDHEAKFVAKRLLQEANAEVGKLDGIIKTANDACAPLLEHGGEKYLVRTSIRTFATALGAHAKAKDLDLDGLFSEAGGGGSIDESSFVAYLARMPEVTGREEIEFTDERRHAIFQQLASGGGSIGKDEFRSIFCEKCVCKTGISITEGFTIAASKTISKIEPGDELETIGLTKEDDVGMSRANV